MSNVPLEQAEAVAFHDWLAANDLNHTHVPNETGHSPEARRRAIRMKRQGTSAGFFDYVIFILPTQSKDGEAYTLFIELKRQRGGTISDSQKRWQRVIEKMNTPHQQAYVAKGAHHAIEIVSHYLKFSRYDIF